MSLSLYPALGCLFTSKYPSYNLSDKERVPCSVAVIGLTSSNGFSKFRSLSLSLSYFPFFETSGLNVKRILVCVVEVGTSSNCRLGMVFRSRFLPTKERVITPVLGLCVDLGFNSCVISCLVLVAMTSARLCLFA